MRIATRVFATVAALLTAAAPPGSGQSPEDYAVRLRVVAAPGGGVQRLELPAEAIVALRRRDAADVRVFDARGRMVPIARIGAAAPRRRQTLAASPMLGAIDSPLGARASIRFDERGRARVAEVESGSAASEDVALLGALLDARNVTGSADRLDLDADIPAGQPIRFTVEASRDLETWRPLGARTAYRTPGEPTAWAAIPLDGSAIERDYLRVTWRASSRLIVPVTVGGAVLATHGEAPRIVVTARAPALLDDHSGEFVAPPARLASIRLVPATSDGAMRVRLLGRDNREQPWGLLASGIAAADAAPMALDGVTPRIIRFEADNRGPGFSVSPNVELGFAQQAIAFAGSGGGAFTLTAGRVDADDSYTVLDMPSGPAALPVAIVEHRDSARPLILQARDTATASRLQFVLWAALLAAVALLAGLTWLSFRRRPDPAG